MIHLISKTERKLNMEVEIISKECIVPSSPTPPHLKTYKLSLLDQYSSSIYSPAIFFYPNNQDFTNLTKRSQLLKNSLSETLSRFYPLAGKVKDELSIDCNDQGVYYVEAKANISLPQYLKQPDLASMHKLMSCRNILNEATSVSYLVMIQETTFLCGGFTISLLVCHMFCDGTSMVSFIKDWAATTTRNSSKQILHPFLNASSVFPQNTPFPVEASPITTLLVPLVKKGKYIVRRFVFSASSIASLKTKATNSSSLMNASRVEVVSALLSKSLMAAFKGKTGLDKPLGILHNVNLRKRAVPPLPDCSLGNYIQFAGAVFTPKENELSRLVSQLREGIQKIDSDFVKNIQSEGGLFKFYEMTKELADLFSSPILPGGLMEHVVFSSWCNFGLYDIDFGWGKPLWATWFLSSDNSEMDETSHFKLNTIMLMDARTENGVEAWVYMDEDDIVFLEKNKELLQYATINPSPLLC